MEVEINDLKDNYKTLEKANKSLNETYESQKKAFQEVNNGYKILDR